MTPRKEPPRKPRDLGRAIAVLFCALFALIGAIPLLLSVLVRTTTVRKWAASETEKLLARELGITANYEVEVQAWPMMIALSDLTVEASDGGLPFLHVERVSARPRPFSLIAGQLDIGEVEIDRPWIRAVIKDGELQNLKYRLPKSDSKASRELPFTALAITEARIDLTVEDARVLTEEVDIDVSAEEDGAIESALRASGATITRVHSMPDYPTEDAVDEDRICKLEVRARIFGDDVFIRRLQIAGSVDFDPDAETLPACTLPRGDFRAFDLSLSAVRVSGLTSPQPKGSGRIRIKAPPAIVHRFVKVPHLTGSVSLDADVEYDGGRLPLVTGTLDAEMPGADGKVFSEVLHAEVHVTESAVRLSKIDAVWGSGKVLIAEAKVEPFKDGVPLTAGPVSVKGIDFPDLIRDLGVHPQAIVGWTITDANLPEFSGTLSPLKLEGVLTAETEDFQVFDRSARRQGKRRMIGLPAANLKGIFGVRQEGVVFQNFAVDTPNNSTHINTSVLIEFKNRISLDVAEGTVINLSEVGPLVDIPISGVAKVKANMRGPLSKPKLLGDLSITDFVFAGLPVGQVESAKAEFEPLSLTVSDVHIKKVAPGNLPLEPGKPPRTYSRIHSKRATFAFDKGPVVLIDGEIDTLEEPYAEIHDILDIFNMDRLPIKGSDTKDGMSNTADPRWAPIKGRLAGASRVHFALGGPEDRCGGGILRLDGDFHLRKMDLFGETYPSGDVDFEFVWDDRDAGSNGMRINVRSAILRKGEGTVTASAAIHHGGVLRAQAVASGIPIGSLDVLGEWGSKFDGTISAVARIGGKLDAIDGLIDVDVSRVRVGPATLGPSRLQVEMKPRPPSGGARAKATQEISEALPKPITYRSCSNSAGAPFDYREYLRDETQGDYVVNGTLFGSSIALRDIRISQQRNKDVRGSINVKDLDLGALSNLLPGVAFSAEPPKGSLSATLDIEHLYLTNLPKSSAKLGVSALSISRGDLTAKLLSQSDVIALEGDELKVPGLKIEGGLASGLVAKLTVSGKVKEVLSRPKLDLDFNLEPLDLGRISANLPGVERAKGELNAALKVSGPIDKRSYSGSVVLKDGDFTIKGLPSSLTSVGVEVDIGGGEARIKKASAKFGAGTIGVSGGMPINETSFGTASLIIKAEGVRLPIAEGVQVALNADLEATIRPSAEDPEERLPDVSGTVELTSFSYTRPIELAVNLGQLGSRQRTEVETYDPKNDLLKFDLRMYSTKPLRFTNNLVDMQLEVVEPGLNLSGTNQRFGARGLLRIRPESKLRLRNTEFEVREGSVRFDDPYRIAPKVDVRATAEYRRSTTLTGPTAATPDNGTSQSTQSSSQSGGLWRIGMHAYGNVDALKVDLTSDPALRQEDIVLLLTFGLTRAEIDQGLASSVGETVGLEALSALTGADKAVKRIVPIIDEFRFGTAYSQRTGRTQPMVTVGKRITDSVRATVTTGVTENREVRSTIEWRLDRGVSVQGSYDNSNDTFGLPIGNLGADLRWRIEFE